MAQIAHTDTENGRERVHLLSEHLNSVAKLSQLFAKEFGASDWGRLAGLWHDFGKYSPNFQKRIRGADIQVDHSTAGSILAEKKLGPSGRILAYLIAGHHAGLPDWQTGTSGGAGLAQRLSRTELFDEALKSLPQEEIINQAIPDQKPKPGADPALWIRMLFSCLVDADFLDTETFFDPNKSIFRKDYQELSGLIPHFNSYMENKQTTAENTDVNKIRHDVLNRCIEKASHEPSIFTLTVPTGGGKTLSSMAFALNHAVKYDKKRIIYVIPYTSIIEQTADEFRKIFNDAVVEHHSNLDIDVQNETSMKSRLACENWDTPIIVTTSVQFFESLFSSRTSRCRKLHNIVNSIVVLDEAQLLPPDFLNPIIEVLKELHKNYGVTILMSTATQPALSPLKTSDFNFPGLPDTVEIIKDPVHLQQELKRVEINTSTAMTKPASWEAIADELKEHESFLCIVNRRDDCRTLCRMMPEDTIHLSGLMCGAHRSKVIAEIKDRLNKKIPTRVISTQLVEAGVDIDFPVVFRALAGLDSIAQAAGRCNREGKLRDREGKFLKGQLFVFVPPSEPPRGHLRQTAEIGRRLLFDGCKDLLSHEMFERFFRELYWIKGENLDKHGILKDLKRDVELRFSFRTAAHKFRIIDDSGQASLIVRYGEGNNLIGLLKSKGPERWLMRKLQRFVVNLPVYLHKKLVEDGAISEISPETGVFVQEHSALYDDRFGICPEKQAHYEPDELIF